MELTFYFTTMNIDKLIYLMPKNLVNSQFLAITAMPKRLESLKK